MNKDLHVRIVVDTVDFNRAVSETRANLSIVRPRPPSPWFSGDIYRDMDQLAAEMEALRRRHPIKLARVNVPTWATAFAAASVAVTAFSEKVLEMSQSISQAVVKVGIESMWVDPIWEKRCDLVYRLTTEWTPGWWDAAVWWLVERIPERWL